MSITEPFAPILRLYPGGDPADASTWGAGHDISSYIRHADAEGGQAISWSVGRPDEAAAVDPGALSLTLDNRDGRFSTANPNGPYYGTLRRGTPIALTMQSGADDFNRVEVGGLGTSSSGATWTGTTNWSANGTNGAWSAAAANLATHPELTDAGAYNISARFTVWPTVAATGAALVYGLALRGTDANNFFLPMIEFAPAGAITVMLRSVVGGSLLLNASLTLAATYVANDKWRVLAQCDGPNVRLKAWKPANPSLPDDDEPDDWTITATQTTLLGTGVGLYFWRVVGNTNAGAVSFPVDDLVYEVPEFTGSVVQWPMRWDRSGNNSWAPIQAAGILRRLQQGAGTLKSPLTQQLSTYSPTGYWPLEDGSDAQSFGALTIGTRPALKVGTVTPAADSTLPGASVSPTLGSSGAYIRAYTQNRQTGGGFAVMFLMKLSVLPAAKTKIASFSAAGRIVTWNLYIDNLANLYTEGIESDGTVTINSSSSMSTADPLNWVAYQIEASVPATMEWATLWHEVGEVTYFVHSGAVGGAATPQLYGATLGDAASDLSGAAFAHLWIGEEDLPFVTDSFSLVSDGYRGELASDRISRLCSDEGVPVAIEAGDSEPLGAQEAGTLLNAIQAAADADMGILYEYANGLGYRPRSARYSQEVAIALSVAAGEIADPPEPIDDDQRVRNDWTVSRTDGSSARVYDQAHIDAEGRYADSVTINVHTDDVLTDHAGWRLYLGTRAALRWPGLTLNFARTPELLPAWRQAGYSPRITVTTGLDQVSTADPDVIVEGYTATLTPTEFRISANCSAAKPWDQVALDGGLRLDTAGSTLATAEDTTSTSWSVATSTGPIWVTTALHSAEFPFDVICEGEVVTVTAITGTSSPQTFTVTRSTNGIVKSHEIGAEISLAIPTYLAL